MKVLVAQKCGFCPGVRNAIQMAKDTLGREKCVYSLGEVIHNKDVVDKLAGEGLKTVTSVEQIPSGTVLIRSHGATAEQFREIEDKGMKIIDATCVLVKRVQKIAQKLHDDGYLVVIIGDKGHPEVQAIVGSAGNVVVVGNENDILNLPENRKLGVICQTTQSPEHFGNMVALIVKKGFSEMKIIDTLCKEAIKRQTEAIQLCRQVDVMFVLGGLHSANTRKLAELCKKHNSRTFHLQNWQELDIISLSGKKVAGVTAGASTPEWIIEEFVENLRKFDAGG